MTQAQKPARKGRPIRSPTQVRTTISTVPQWGYSFSSTSANRPQLLLLSLAALLVAGAVVTAGLVFFGSGEHVGPVGSLRVPGGGAVSSAQGASSRTNGTTGLSILVTTSPSSANGSAPLTVAFQATVSGGAPPYGANWNFGDSSPWGQGLNVSHTYKSSGRYLACGYGYDQKNASATQCVPVTVVGMGGGGNGTNNSSLSLQVTTSPSPANGTAPLTVTFLAAVSGGTPPYGVNWNFGDGTWGSGLTVQHTYRGVGTFTACGNAYDALNHSVTQCVNVTAQSNSSSLTVTASAHPISGNAPLSVEFWANVTGGVPPYAISWSFGDGGNGSGAPINHTYGSAGTYSNVVVVTDANRNQASAAMTVTVGNNSTTAPLKVTLNLLPSRGIAPQNVSIHVQATGGTPTYSLKISTGIGNQTLGLAPWSGASEDFQVEYTSAGVYTVTAYVVDSAGSVASQSYPLDLGSDVMTVGMNVSPLQGAAPLNVTFTIGQVSGGLGPYMMQLFFGDGAVAFRLVPGEVLHHVYVNPGTFRVILNVTSGQGQVTSVFGNVLVTNAGAQGSGASTLDSEYVLAAGAGGAAAVLAGYYLVTRWRGRAVRKLLS